MDIEERNNLYKLFLKSFLKINNKSINNDNVTSFDLFISTTRVYKFTNWSWSKAIKNKAEKCQKILLETICDTLKDCRTIKTTSEAKLLDKIFNKFAEDSKNLKTLEKFIDFSIDDLNIKKIRLNTSKEDKEEYYETFKQFNRLNLFIFVEQQEKINSTRDEVDEEQFELTFDY